MELIKLPTSLGLKVIKLLEEKKIEIRKCTSGFFKDSPSLEFTQEELNLITKLDIVNPCRKEIEGIEHLKNLEVLNISTPVSSEYVKNPHSISDKDISNISKLKSLKSLTIDNQSYISWINVDGLENLEELCITRNSNLEEICGLDKLSKLQSFTERGNKQLFVIDGIQSLIHNNNLDFFKVDLLHFPEIVNESKKLLNMYDCRISEQLTGEQNREIIYNFYTTNFFHKKCLEIATLAKNCSSDYRNQILFVEKYLAENIFYDYDALKTQNRVHYDNEQKKGKNNGTNSAFNGIMYGSAVCEGYTRSMQYILKLMGIKTKNVYCISGKDKIKIDESYHNMVTLPNDGYHSIIRIDFDNGIYYFDPCWDSCYWHAGDKTLPYSFLTKKEMSKDHTFSFEEDDVIFDISVPRKNIENALLLFENDNKLSR